MVISRSYRIDHKTLAWSYPSSLLAPVLPADPSPTLSPAVTTKQCKILALTIQSLHSPDTIMAYCEYKDAVPLPIGLIPGAVITLDNFKLKTSKSGNSYCTNFAMSSVHVNSVSAVVDHVIDHTSTGSTSQCWVLPQHFGLPVTLMSELMQALIDGTLSRGVVCVRPSHVTVQRLCMEYKCRGCQCVIANGRCSVACLRHRPVLEVTARYCDM